ncbi:bis(5'-nucleosyl)-tetraphosphatase [asymmetrical] [Contarinia nasturtii]|uniref:bis(5'-nucleosyl)-tetraphosphatase [asymmetrical] n=1 Tax=Contarinia nasturtii TaxID=265458 RepID=UPI0012D3892C|nr:bis(5'-nucleosyl)-tetraphosphatase [asymmetrical] [Contarinia nasturtii]
MIKMRKRAAGFLIFRRLNSQIEYLLLKASYGNYHWTPPKGHVDPGEDDFTTALRETREEAGYSADDLKIYKDEQKILNYKVKGKNKTVVYWLAELKDGHNNPTLSDEHTEFRWLPKDEAISLSGYADFAQMVQYFHDRIGKL